VPALGTIECPKCNAPLSRIRLTEREFLCPACRTPLRSNVLGLSIWVIALGNIPFLARCDSILLCAAVAAALIVGLWLVLWRTALRLELVGDAHAP